MKKEAKRFNGRIANVSRNFREKTNWSVSQISQLINAALATDFASQSDRYLRSLFDSAPNVYDRAMDSWREVSGNFGFDHRIFDGGHGMVDAWKAIENALPNDSFREETLGYLSAYWKDLVTPMGMPIKTLNKDYFDRVSDVASSLGIERGYLLDLVSFTATEGAGALAAVVGASLNWKKSDVEKFAEHASSIAMASALAANPLALTISILLLARSYHIGRRQGRLSSIFKQFGWGASKSVAFIGAASLVGGGAWLGVVAGLSAAVIVERMKSRVSENDEIYTTDFMSQNLIGNVELGLKKLIERNPN